MRAIRPSRASTNFKLRFPKIESETDRCQATARSSFRLTINAFNSRSLKTHQFQIAGTNVHSRGRHGFFVPVWLTIRPSARQRKPRVAFGRKETASNSNLRESLASGSDPGDNKHSALHLVAPIGRSHQFAPVCESMRLAKILEHRRSRSGGKPAIQERFDLHHLHDALSSFAVANAQRPMRYGGVLGIPSRFRNREQLQPGSLRIVCQRPSRRSWNKIDGSIPIRNRGLGRQLCRIGLKINESADCR